MRAGLNIRAGRLEGQDRGGVLCFRGIPYAKAPEGELRFRPPEPVEPWVGARRAVRSGSSAPQLTPGNALLGRLIGVGRRDQNEDCLSLNVWTPAADGRRRPVMVWIHGGAFVLGSGGTGMYSGSRLARRGDVVVVTLNYRLGALGFLDLTSLGVPGAEGTANLGIRDQIAALEWVRDEIEGFGGDPENVTIFGESAGGMSVGTLLGTPRAQGLFHRAILQSGAANHVSPREKAQRVAETFLSELGASGDALMALRSVSAARILEAQQRATFKLGIRQGTLPWQPSVDGDLIPQQPMQALAEGAGDVPVLIGTNCEEWKLFSLGDRSQRSLDDAGLARRFERVLPGKNAEGTGRAQLALDFYSRPIEGRQRSPGARFGSLMTDRVFRAPAFVLADQHASHSQAGTYSYLFDWRVPVLGACHGLEIPFVFGTLRAPVMRQLVGASRSARELSRAMQQAWIAFARAGDPGHSGLPQWPRYAREHGATMTFGRRTGIVRGRSEQERQVWEASFASD